MNVTAVDFLTHWKVVSAVLGKYDGRDKCLASLQYAMMAVAGGKPGWQLTMAQALGASRKPFRFGKPLELAVPVLFAQGPYAVGSGPEHRRLLAKLKALGLIAFVGLDNIGWLNKVGAISVGGKEAAAGLSKASFRGWFVASVAQLLLELDTLARAVAKGAKAADAGDLEGVAAANKARDKAAIAATQAAAQTLLSAGLAQVITGMSPRQLGTVGVVSSGLSLYSMVSALMPPRKAKTV